MKIIDVHTHAFPDPVAAKAIPALEAGSGTRAVGNGTVASLVASMSAAGVSSSVIASIATKPGQANRITEWSRQVGESNSSLIPFGSVHPDGDWKTALSEIKHAGLKGVKLHPYYQNFTVDEDRMYPLYEKIRELGLVALFHAGYDMGYERFDRAHPKRFNNLWKRLPGLKAVLAHLGGWFAWDLVMEYLPETGFFIDSSYCDGFITPDQFEKFVNDWPKDRLCFGSDFPWAGQKQALEFVNKMGLDPGEIGNVLAGNIGRLMGIGQDPS